MHISKAEQHEIASAMARAIAASKDVEGTHGVVYADHLCAQAAWRVVCERLGIEYRLDDPG